MPRREASTLPNVKEMFGSDTLSFLLLGFTAIPQPALPLYLFHGLWPTVPDKQRGAMLICPWNEGAVTGFSQTQEELFCINLLTQRRTFPPRRRKFFHSGKKRIFSRSPLPGARIARSTCSMTALPLQQACPISATSFPAPSRTSSPATRL